MSDPIGGGTLPVTSGADVLAEYPQSIREVSPAPVRDSLCEAQAVGFQEYQRRAEEIAGHCNPLKAEGFYLDSFAYDHEVYRTPEESDTDLRARIFKRPPVVTPDAILDAVSEVISPYTTVEPRLYEAIDGWFVQDGTATWSSHVGAPPEYPDREYSADPRYAPPGAVPFAAGSERLFIVRIPELSQADDYISFEGSLFVGDGTSTVVNFFTWASTETSENLYKTVVGRVNPIKGQGIRWGMIVDGQ